MKVLVVYYSLYGHTIQLAKAVKEGAESVPGTKVLFRRVEEFEVVIKKTEVAPLAVAFGYPPSLFPSFVPATVLG